MKILIHIFRLAFVCVIVSTFCASQSSQDTPEQLATIFGHAIHVTKTGDYRTAERIYLDLLNKDPGLWQAQLNLGIVYHMDRKYSQSLRWLNMAITAKPELYEALLVAGKDYLNLGKPRESIPLLRHARELHPNDNLASYYLASAEYLAEDDKNAVLDYVHYLTIPGNDKDARAWYALADAVSRLGDTTVSRLGSMDPQNPWLTHFLVRTYISQQRWNEAKAKLSSLKSQSLWREQAGLELGEVHLHENEAALAISDFQQVLSVEPNRGRARLGLGLALLANGRTEEGYAELIRVENESPLWFANPDSLATVITRARSRIEQASSQQKSGTDLVDAFVREFSNPQPGIPSGEFPAEVQNASSRNRETMHRQLAEMLRNASALQVLVEYADDLLQMNDTESLQYIMTVLPRSIAEQRYTIPILRTQLAMSKDDPLEAASLIAPLVSDEVSEDILYFVAIALQRIVEAICRRILTVAPESAYSHLIRGRISDAEKHPSDAIAEFQMAVKVAPDEPASYFRLGETLWRSSRFGEALVPLEQGLKLDPYHPLAEYQLGDAYYRVGETADALRHLDEAVRLNPAEIAARKDLAKIYFRQRKFEASVAVLAGVADRDEDGSIHYLLSHSYTALGKNAAAISSIREFERRKAQSAAKRLFTRDVIGQRDQPDTGLESDP
jgi:tetratricopeptide (TPR) repeat protein